MRRVKLNGEKTIMILENYQKWLRLSKDKEIKDELVSINGKNEEIEDRFYRVLSFGTGGLRGIIGAGTNRMNIYTVSRATFGLAEYLLSIGGDSIVIAYDSRNKSSEFARLAAEIMSSRGIKAYLFSELTPTPVLSFAVRYLQASAGIVITASHNPKEYNGYKVYNSFGCQITDEAADAITEKINQYDYFNDFMPKQNLIEILDERVKNAFIEAIKAISLTKITEKNAPVVVYSPLHGTGRRYVTRILREIGVKELYVVAEQEAPDANFTTCCYPNPEEKEALAFALRDAEKYKPDVVLATDPDADRIGVALPNEKGEYFLLNGNETGVLIMDYMLSRKSEKNVLGENPTIIKTIVTTDMAFEVAKTYNAKVKEVLTGFKYVGEELDKTENYIMGLEESYGYLVGNHARDKDAVSAAMMIVEMCAYYKREGKKLYEILKILYERYGYYLTDLDSFKYEGQSGMTTMSVIIEKIRNAPFKKIDGEEVEFTDFSKGVNGLPQSNVLRFKNDNIRLIIRPSGTEPKLKIYYQVKGKTEQDCNIKLKRLMDYVRHFVGKGK